MNYPYPYGFILNTTGGDGDNLDVFVITDKKLKSGQIIECEPIGIMEQIEITVDSDGQKKEQEDHNVLAVLPGEYGVYGAEVREVLSTFVSHVFDHLPEKQVRVGRFLDKAHAIDYIEACKDT